MKMIGAKINGKQVIGYGKGNGTPVEYHSWRTPELGDKIGGKVLKFTYKSSDPIAITGYEGTGYNNSYLLTSNRNYFVQEMGSYEQVDVADDYSWERMKFSATLTISNASTGYIATVYQCDSIVYCDWNNGVNNVESTTEVVRLSEILLPSDFGDVYAYGGTMLGINCQVDDYRVEKRPYELKNLTGEENINTSMVLIPTFPDNADKLMLPSLPTPDEYGSYILGDEFTLYGGEFEWYEDGQEYPTSDVWYVMANLFEDYDYETGESRGMILSVAGQMMMDGQTMWAKKYGTSEVITTNRAIVTPAMGVSCLLKNLTPFPLNTSSPLYQYIKKVEWL